MEIKTRFNLGDELYHIAIPLGATFYIVYDKEEIEKYSERADKDILKVRKCIIKYDNEQEKKELKQLFNRQNLKVIYKCEELIRMED